MLEIKQVNYSTKSQIILRDVNLKIAAGEWVVITGPSGSGKSTLLKLIANLISPTSGKILLGGQDISKRSPNQYRQEVSYCFQQAVLFGDTVEDNFKFVFEVHQQPFDEAKALKRLEQVQLPASYLHQKITDLSGGEKQRVALVRNTLFLPKILLLDEVTAGLDLETIKIISQWFQQLQEQGVTLIAVTHDTNELAVDHRQIFVEQGRVREVAK